MIFKYKESGFVFFNSVINRRMTVNFLGGTVVKNLPAMQETQV